MKVKFSSVRSFSFQLVSTDDVSKVRDLKNNKSVSGEIPIEILTNYINKSIETGCFLDSLKIANFNPIYKIDDALDKSNYGLDTVIILPLV